MWTYREIEQAVRNAFVRLGYPTVKREQLEAAGEFVKGKDVYRSPHGSQQFKVTITSCSHAFLAVLIPA